MAFPATYNISYYSGDTYQFIIKPKNSNGSSFSMPSTIYTPKFYISPSRGGSAISITNKVLTSNVATLTTSVAHGYSVNTIITVSGVDATFNGAYKITAVPSTTTFSYEKTNADVVSAAASGSVINTIEATASITSSEYSVVNKYLNSNTATLTTSSPHNYLVGDTVSVSGVDATFNGNYTITSKTSNTFSYAKTASNVASTAVSPAGTVVSLTVTATNAITCTITPVVGNLLAGGASYFYDISISRDSGATIYTLMTGTISVTDDITAA
jgi:hypothetical protein